MMMRMLGTSCLVVLAVTATGMYSLCAQYVSVRHLDLVFVCDWLVALSLHVFLFSSEMSVVHCITKLYQNIRLTSRKIQGQFGQLYPIHVASV